MSQSTVAPTKTVSLPILDWIKGTRNYYFKTKGYCSRTKVKSPLTDFKTVLCNLAQRLGSAQYIVIAVSLNIIPVQHDDILADILVTVQLLYDTFCLFLYFLFYLLFMLASLTLNPTVNNYALLRRLGWPYQYQVNFSQLGQFSLEIMLNTSAVRQFTWEELISLNQKHNAHVAVRGKVRKIGDGKLNLQTLSGIYTISQTITTTAFIFSVLMIFNCTVSSAVSGNSECWLNFLRMRETGFLMEA